MRLTLFTATVLTLVTMAHADDLTLGEREFIKAVGRDCPVVRLWPEGKMPDEPRPLGEEKFATENKERGTTGLLNISQVTSPSMVILTAPKEKNTGATIVLAPGGGYGSLGAEMVRETAEWMNERGINIVLLKYRVPKRGKDFPMNHQPVQDAQRALGILRTRAKEWQLDPAKIGIGGFSAGGHLAASLSINHAKRWYEPIDDFDRASCRPDFAVLLYPAYLTDPIDSRTRDTKLHYDLINDKDTPPTLIAVTRPDKFTIGCVEYYLALMEKNVSAELHVYPEGGHGGSIKKYPLSEWAKECVRFLGDHNLIAGPAKPTPHTYKAKTLADIAPSEGLTLGDQRLRQILGRDCPVVPVWPTVLGPDESLQPGPERAQAESRGGNALSIYDVTRPTLTIIEPPADKRTGRAAVVSPGGGFSRLAIEHEGLAVCDWLNQQGVTALLLKYRVPARGGDYPKHHQALQDVQRAIRLARANADAWKIDPKQLGVCGLSAGGNISAALCVNHAQDLYKPIDAVDKQSAKPDFGLLIYPAYLSVPATSNELAPQVQDLKRNGSPPLFLSCARNDGVARGMLNFFLHARAQNILAECHVYSTGGHGGGLDPISYPASEWTQSGARWLSELKIK